MASATFPCADMRPSHICRQRGFTLLEVLVALLIVGTALGASLRAVGSLTQNSIGLRAAMMATWSAENRLTHLRPSRQWPDLSHRDFACPQGELPLHCTQQVLATAKPLFRRVEVSVYADATRQQKLATLTQVI